jgi:hypothetical protein
MCVCDMMTILFNKRSHPLLGDSKITFPRRGKHVSAVTNNQETTEELLKYLHHSATLFLGDINTGTSPPPKLEESRI